MAAAFVRRFLFDPGDDVLLEIESVNILDLEPPADISGIGTGTVCMVAEFEDGPFNEPTEVASATDLRDTFGALGFGEQCANPCARSRKADNAVTAEPWNGNGAIHLNGKKFKRLVLVRVDTSVGAVQFYRLANHVGSNAPTFNLEPGQTLVTNVGGLDITATFNAAAAHVTGSGFAGTMAAGETATLGYDDQPDVTVVFLVTDVTIADCIARINAAFGFTFASNDGGEIKLTSRQRGTGAEVRVVSGTGLTKLGLTVADTAGTGNVVNIDAVTAAEAHTVVHAANSAVTIVRLASGAIRAEAHSTTPGTATELTIGSGSTATAFGFQLGVKHTSAAGNAGSIPAGTLVQTAGGARFVTCRTLAVEADNAGSYSTRVRHALDDGSVSSTTAAGAVVQFGAPIELDAFDVINPLPMTAALTEAALDAQYGTALDSTLDLNSVARTVNITFSARQSNAVRRALRQNALTASAIGMYGRITCIRPALGTPKATAKSTSAEPGVGAYRDQRVIYNYPGLQTQVPAIARVGTAGGAGFTADGMVDVGSDGFLASLMSQLPPEENPGQETSFMGGAVALESSAVAKGLTMDDYIAFKAAGICAPRFEDGACIYQSGVTSVDPLQHPNLTSIARRRFADYLQDSLAQRLKSYGKKLQTAARRTAVKEEVRQFARTLCGFNGGAQRMAGFDLDTKSGNTPQSTAKGLWRIILKARMLPDFLSIVLQTEVGTTVQVKELAA